MNIIIISAEVVKVRWYVAIIGFQGLLVLDGKGMIK